VRPTVAARQGCCAARRRRHPGAAGTAPPWSALSTSRRAFRPISVTRCRSRLRHPAANRASRRTRRTRRVSCCRSRGLSSGWCTSRPGSIRCPTRTLVNRTATCRRPGRQDPIIDTVARTGRCPGPAAGLPALGDGAGGVLDPPDRRGAPEHRARLVRSLLGATRDDPALPQFLPWG